MQNILPFVPLRANIGKEA